MELHEIPTPCEETVSIDWITVTCTEMYRRVALRTAGSRLQGVMQAEGHRVAPWFFRGYQGARFGPVCVGDRNDSTILVVSGPASNDAILVLHAIPQNCSRVDLAVNLRYDPPWMGLANRAYGEIEEGKLGAWETGNCTLLRNNGGGETLYLGSRTSERMLRVYDWGVRHKLAKPGEIWRFEVEMKGARAKAVYTALERNRRVEPVASYEIQAVLKRWGQERLWPAQNIGSATEVSAVCKSEETTLQWLRLQVGPAVARLLDRGRLDAVEAALGYKLILVSDKGE